MNQPQAQSPAKVAMETSMADIKTVSRAESFATRLSTIAKQSTLLQPTSCYEFEEGRFLQIRASDRYFENNNLAMPAIKDSQFKLHINIDANSYDAKIQEIFAILMTEFAKYSVAPRRAAKDIVFTQMKYLTANTAAIHADIVLFPDAMRFYDLVKIGKFAEANLLIEEKNLLCASPFRAKIKHLTSLINQANTIVSDTERAKAIVSIGEEAGNFQKEAVMYKHEAERLMHGTQITIYLTQDVMTVPVKQKAIKKFVNTLSQQFADKNILTGTCPQSDVLLAKNCPVSLRNTGAKYVAGATDNLHDLLVLKEQALRTPLYTQLTDRAVEQQIHKLKNLLQQCQNFLFIQRNNSESLYTSQKNVVRVLLKSLESQDDLPSLRLIKFNELYKSMKSILTEKVQRSNKSCWDRFLSFFTSPTREFDKNIRRIDTILAEGLPQARENDSPMQVQVRRMR